MKNFPNSLLGKIKDPEIRAVLLEIIRKAADIEEVKDLIRKEK